MRFTGQFIGAKLDLGVYKALMEAHLKDELNRVADAWLSGVTGRVPIWSGMSQGSLLELVELINGKLVITPKGGVKNRIPQGRALGTATPTYGPNDFIIEIVTKVPHYTTQEYTNVGVSKSAPWRSLAAGMASARLAMESVTLPPLVFKPIKI